MPHRLPTWSEVNAQGASPTALALRDALMHPPDRQPAPHEPEAFVDVLSRLLARATVQDCVWAGFTFDAARSPLYGCLVEHGCRASIELSGDDASSALHRAVCVGWIDDYGTRAWVDGVELPVPRDEDGRPQADPHGTGWCAQRWFFIEIGGLHGHPRSDPADQLRLGTVRGLLVWDAERRTAHLEWPREDEAWTSPGASVRDGRLLVHASRARMHVDAPARSIPLDQAFSAAA
jgi:hypothetical protein